MASEAEALRLSGNEKYKAGAFAEALDLYKQCVALDDTSHSARHNIALCHMQLREYALALETVNRALAKAGEPGVAKYYSTKGGALMQLGRRDEAITAYKAGLLIDPTSASLATSLANAQARPAAASGGGAGSRPAPTRAAGSGGGGMVGTLGSDGFPVSSPLRVESPLEEQLLSPASSTTIRAVAALRLVSLASLLLYLLPFTPLRNTLSMWRAFLAASAVVNTIVTFTKHAMPALSMEGGMTGLMSASNTNAMQAYINQLMNDASAPSLVLPLIALGLRPNVLLILPIAALSLWYALEALGGPLVLGRIPALQGVVDAVAARATSLVAPNVAAGSTALVRRNGIASGLLHTAAVSELVYALFLVAMLLTPQRSLLGCVFMYQLLQLRYMLVSYSRVAFRSADALVRSVTAHPYCPAVVSRGYDALAGFLAAQGRAPIARAEAQTRGGGGARGGGAGGGPGLMGRLRAAASSAASSCSVQ